MRRDIACRGSAGILQVQMLRTPEERVVSLSAVVAAAERGPTRRCPAPAR